ncbi:hypothetical protein Ae201684P_011694 [Aphanomyces euteiches]|uniref:HTH CENPB-type domain-containing protein n=1 Tax=Aphanomyces euteiches TaxID=100861 RepID=A0A6G0WUN5_9STRA|nr:hypothetical protein Ae201684_011441 [Aphanomyces euteiches]KAH9096961.1 hypothetical protein Ae201684P_011694 [Aphanomyces euteiches]
MVIVLKWSQLIEARVHSLSFLIDHAPTFDNQTEDCYIQEQNPHWTRSDLVAWATREFKLNKPPTKSTITRILQTKMRLLGLDTDELQSDRKQVHPFASLDLERELWSWFQNKEKDGITLSGQIITTKAERILQSMGNQLI